LNRALTEDLPAAQARCAATSLLITVFQRPLWKRQTSIEPFSR
jgi:hypothetical protein